MLVCYFACVFSFFDPFNSYPDLNEEIEFSTGSSSFDYSSLDQFNNLITIKKLSNKAINKIVITFTRNKPSSQIANNKSVITTLRKQLNGRYSKYVRVGVMKKFDDDEDVNDEQNLLGIDESHEIDAIVDELQILSKANGGIYDPANYRYKSLGLFGSLELGNNIANQIYKEPLIQKVISKLYQYVD